MGMGGSDPRLAAFVQMLRERKRQQAMDLISKAQPGQTVEDLGLTPKSFKRVYGRKPKAGEVLVPQTPVSIMQQKTVELLGRLPGPMIETLALSAVTREMTGEPGVTTQESLGSRAKAATTKAETEVITAGTAQTQAQTFQDLVNEGIDYVKKLPALKRRGLAQKMAVGTTAEAEEEALVGSQLRTELNREALKFALAPRTHAFGQLLQSKLDMDPVAVMTSTVLGTNSLLHQMAELTVANVNRRTAMDSELAQAAREMSKLMGFRLNPNEVMTIWKEGGTRFDPEPGNNSAAYFQKNPGARAVRLMENTASIMGRAALTEAQQKGDPRAITLKAVDDMLRQTRDPNAADAVSQLYRKTQADLLTEQDLGPRPEVVGPEQANWDKAHQGYMNVLPGLKERGRGNPFSGGVEPVKPMGATIRPQYNYTAPVPSAAPTGTPAPKPSEAAAIKLPAGTPAGEAAIWQSIIDSLYNPTKPPQQ